MALSETQIALMYETAKRVHQDGLIRARALDILESAGVSRERAADCIQNFKRMRSGERYTRTLTGATTKYFLEQIHQDFHAPGLDLALSALIAHVRYLEPIRNAACQQERRMHKQFTALLSQPTVEVYPDEVPADHQQVYIEGATRQVLVNQYERDPKARSACIEHWKPICYVCRFDFHKTYGEMGRGFIHVHHLIDIASIGTEYQVDPRNDLRPVCPNCHAMLHTQRPALDIEVLRRQLLARDGDADSCADGVIG